MFRRLDDVGVRGAARGCSLERDAGSNAGRDRSPCPGRRNSPRPLPIRSRRIGPPPARGAGSSIVSIAPGATATMRAAGWDPACAIWIGSMAIPTNRIFDSIERGRAHGMPAWGRKLSQDQIWRLVTYPQDTADLERAPTSGAIMNSAAFTSLSIALALAGAAAACREPGSSAAAYTQAGSSAEQSRGDRSGAAPAGCSDLPGAADLKKWLQQSPHEGGEAGGLFSGQREWGDRQPPGRHLCDGGRA